MSNEILFQELIDATSPGQSSSLISDGVVTLPVHSTKLCFSREDSVGFVDLLAPTTEQLNRLAKACEPTPLRQNNDGILDDEHRKAGKLDVTNFAFNFDLSTTGILDKIVKDRLAHDGTIRADLAKLHLFGLGSFSAPRKDTGTFGSLVIVLPIPHEGGEMILRPDGLPEVRYDSGSILKKHGKQVIIYAAFYGEVEHEVLPVTAGYRVTLIYNLYLNDVPTMCPPTPLTSPLNHPIGKDAIVVKLCNLLNLQTIFKVVYHAHTGYSVHYPALDEIPIGIDGSIVDEEETIFDVLMRSPDAMELKCGRNYDFVGNDLDSDDEEDITRVIWIIKPDFERGLRMFYIKYHERNAFEGAFCFLIPVFPFAERIEQLIPILREFAAIYH
ncbi:hypothetical protein ONZ45_g18506 [Pleurotus djamor]|nr:hypothetical protein ONZ45_g18506 [Pleurotus djamor]